MNILKGGMLAGKKTYVSAAIGIVGAVGAYLVGEMELKSMLEVVLPLVGVIFLRKTIG